MFTLFTLGLGALLVMLSPACLRLRALKGRMTRWVRRWLSSRPRKWAASAARLEPATLVLIVIFPYRITSTAYPGFRCQRYDILLFFGQPQRHVICHKCLPCKFPNKCIARSQQMDFTQSSRQGLYLSKSALSGHCHPNANLKRNGRVMQDTQLLNTNIEKVRSSLVQFWIFMILPQIEALHVCKGTHTFFNLKRPKLRVRLHWLDERSVHASTEICDSTSNICITANQKSSRRCFAIHNCLTIFDDGFKASTQSRSIQYDILSWQQSW
jgi:hypothetical protein